MMAMPQFISPVVCCTGLRSNPSFECNIYTQPFVNTLVCVQNLLKWNCCVTQDFCVFHLARHCKIAFQRSCTISRFQQQYIQQLLCILSDETL